MKKYRKRLGKVSRRFFSLFNSAACTAPAAFFCHRGMKGRQILHSTFCPFGGGAIGIAYGVCTTVL